MDPDDLFIRPARSDEAELLSHLIFRARAYWDYPRELMDHWMGAGELSILPEEIEKNPTYVVEDTETDEIVGFYSIGTDPQGACWLNELYVSPEFVGTEIAATLFLHACELAETTGAEVLFIVSDPHVESFFEEMGAGRIGEKIVQSPLGDRELPVLELKL